jgi:hypothetical protein
MPGPVGAFEKARANLSDRMLKIVVPKADGADASPRSMRLM